MKKLSDLLDRFVSEAMFRRISKHNFKLVNTKNKLIFLEVVFNDVSSDSPSFYNNSTMQLFQ